VAVGLEEFYY
jgi:hypothetical protein